MGDLTRSRRWHDLRRSIAIGGIGLWFLLGGLPLAALGIWWSRGEQLAASPVEIVLQFVLPAALQTASAVCAIGVLDQGAPAGPTTILVADRPAAPQHRGLPRHGRRFPLASGPADGTIYADTRSWRIQPSAR